MKNKKSDGFTLIELIGVIAILAIIISLGTGIYINIRKNALEKQYENVVERIENKALEYARDLNTIEVLNLSVQFLIDKGYIMPDDNYYIYDPRDNSILNCYMVHVIFDDGSYEATWTGNEYKKDGECDFSKLEAGDIEILCNGSSCKDDWYNNDLTLTFIGLSYDLNNSKIEWTSLHGEYQNALSIMVNPTSIIDTMYKLKITPNDANKQVREAKANIKIDKEKPIVVSATLGNGTGKWVTSNSLTFELSDKNGSGVYGYALTKDSCDVAPYIKALTNKVTVDSVENGTYKLCVKDNAGNINEYKNEIVVTKVDDIDPKINVETSKTWDLINTATITFKDEESGLAAYGIEDENGFVTWINVSEDESKKSHTITKTYSINKTYKAYAKDIAGNEKEANVIINHIDKEGPEITIKELYSSWVPTPNVDFTFNETKSSLLGYKITELNIEPTVWDEISGNTETKRQRFTKNGTYYVWAKDTLGNVSKKEFEIKNVDNTPPTYVVDGIPSSWVNTPRNITFTATDTQSGFKEFTYILPKSALSFGNGISASINPLTLNIKDSVIMIMVSDYAYNSTFFETIETNIDTYQPFTEYLILEDSCPATCTKNDKESYEDNYCTVSTGGGDCLIYTSNWDNLYGSKVKYRYLDIYDGGTLTKSYKLKSGEKFPTYSRNTNNVEYRSWTEDNAGNVSAKLHLYFNY